MAIVDLKKIKTFVLVHFTSRLEWNYDFGLCKWNLWDLFYKCHGYMVKMIRNSNAGIQSY